MIPIIPDPSAAAERAVHGAGEADGEPADTTREGASMLGLRDEMDVIGLDRILDDPELGASSGGEGAEHGRERPAGAEAAEGRHGPERHVDGMRGDMR
jgi:hypothetical protein